VIDCRPGCDYLLTVTVGPKGGSVVYISALCGELLGKLPGRPIDIGRYFYEYPRGYPTSSAGFLLN